MREGIELLIAFLLWFWEAPLTEITPMVPFLIEKILYVGGFLLIVRWFWKKMTGPWKDTKK